jgi:transcriptional regulator GlxA family with amidase domain
MLAFLSAVEPLRVANRLSGRPLYKWSVVSSDGASVMANNGMSLATDGDIDELSSFDALMVCGAHEPGNYVNTSVHTWLRRLASRGVLLGGLETGSYLLAQARLLNGYRCTIHWENLPGFEERFPQVEVSSELFEFDRNRATCAGGTAALDMMLQIIEGHHGFDLAVAVSEVFIHSSIRKAHDAQRMTLRMRTGVTNRSLLECLELMEANLEQPLTPDELARAVDISRRQLERLFKRHLGTTPIRYYSNVRLVHAQRLLEQTSLSVTEVALACGFPSPGHFSHRYRELFGVSPREGRIVATRHSARRSSS